MNFSDADKKKAMAIVRIFETGKPAGDYAACAVLDDGAGISYGISQFTHRSGSLAAVVERYLATGCQVGRTVLTESLPVLNKKTAFAVKQASANERLKKALQAAAITSDMRAAQDEASEQIYLKPAIVECSSLGFTQPLSLAVIYDSMTHGSWDRIRDAVGGIASAPKWGESTEKQSFSANRAAEPQPDQPGIQLTLFAIQAAEPEQQAPVDEKKWIAAYVRKRDAWLASVTRLTATRYRTQFFLRQIAISNWELKLPVVVHGVRLTCEQIETYTCGGCTQKCSRSKDLAAGQPQSLAENTTQKPAVTQNVEPSKTEVRPPNTNAREGSQTEGSGETCLEKIESAVDAAAEKYDRVESVVEKVITRTDSAKSLWTMIAGTAWQTLWGLIGFFAGLPKEIWALVAVIVGVLSAVYLYRQIVLGRIREAQVRNER
jgi:chitosanase